MTRNKKAKKEGQGEQEEQEERAKVETKTGGSDVVRTEIRLPSIIQIELSAEETRQLLKLHRRIGIPELLDAYKHAYNSNSRLLQYGLTKACFVKGDKQLVKGLDAETNKLWVGIQAAAKRRDREGMRKKLEELSKVSGKRGQWWLELTELGRQLIKDRKLQVKTNRNVRWAE